MSDGLFFISIIINLVFILGAYPFYILLRERDERIESLKEANDFNKERVEEERKKNRILENQEKYVYETLTRDEVDRIKLDILLAEESNSEKLRETINELKEKLILDKFAKLLNASQEESTEWRKERFLAYMPEMTREILDEKRVFLYKPSIDIRIELNDED